MVMHLLFLVRSFPKISLIASTMLAISLGILFAKIETLRLSTPFITHEMTIPISGRILSWEEQEQGGHRLIVRINSVERDAQILVGNKVRLSARSLPEGTTVGAGINGLVSLRPPSGPVRTGAYDFGFHNYYRGITAQGFFMGPPKLIPLTPPQSLHDRFDLAIAKLRTTMSQRIQANLEGEAGAVASALITGQRGGISDKTNQALRISGLAHILSISGLHMAMVTGMVLLIGRAILGLFTHFSSTHPPKKIAALFALAFSSFYLALSGADIAAQRSFIMVAIMLLAVLCDRAAITMRNLSLSAIVILIYAPHEILSPGFQMSFAATAALISAFGWWSRRPKKTEQLAKSGYLGRYILYPALSTGIASLIAGGASGLFAAYHFANTAPLGLISNVASLPIMSILVMPPALLAACLMPFGLEFFPLQIMGIGIEGIKTISFWVASLSPDINPGIVTGKSLLLLTLALILFLFMRSSLRLLALMPLALGIVFYLIAPTPLSMIDEDGRLVAVATQSRKLALSHQRPNNFILSNWLPAFDITLKDILLPDKDKGGFICHDLICHTTMANGQVFALAVGKSGREEACLRGNFVHLNYISHTDETCANGTPSINRRQLAKQGAAMIYATDNGYQIKWAQGTSLRPWNIHRILSKTAMGLP